jgi:hypothetical protein
LRSSATSIPTTICPARGYSINRLGVPKDCRSYSASFTGLKISPRPGYPARSKMRDQASHGDSLGRNRPTHRTNSRNWASVEIASPSK